ncbi:MAG: M20/M25/M40 family metallo-hydrolase [Spirochaetia bacterium]
MEINNILNDLPKYQDAAKEIGEIILANLVMISETPAPTFQEQRRVEFLVNRLNEYELQNCSTDEKNNALGLLPGTHGERNILVVAHLDTVFPEEVDHTVTVHPNYVQGPGVADNSLGLASLVSLPLLLKSLDIKLKSNLILMGCSQSLGRGNTGGLRFFLENSGIPIDYGICLEGVKLGRLSYSSIGLLRGEISYKVPEEYDWTRFGAVGAIVTINDVISRILEIPIPRRPRTTIVFGSIDGGKSYNTIATEAVLRFEIRSESAEMVEQLGQKIEDIAAEVSSKAGAEVKFDVFAKREPGGLGFAHPMTEISRNLIKEVGVTPRISPSTSELSAFIDFKIPAVTLGITDGEHLNQENETIQIEPVYKGLSQLLGLILAIDRGYCDESK